MFKSIDVTERKIEDAALEEKVIKQELKMKEIQ